MRSGLFFLLAITVSFSGGAQAHASCDDGPGTCDKGGHKVEVKGGVTVSDYAPGASIGVSVTTPKWNATYETHASIGLEGQPGILAPNKKDLIVVGEYGSSAIHKIDGSKLSFVAGNPALLQATAHHVDFDIVNAPAAWIFVPIPTGINIDHGLEAKGSTSARAIPLGVLYNLDDHTTFLYSGAQVESQQQIIDRLGVFARVKGGFAYASGNQQGAALYGQASFGFRGDLSRHLAVETAVTASDIAVKPDIPNANVKHTADTRAGLSVIGAF